MSIEKLVEDLAYRVIKMTEKPSKGNIDAYSISYAALLDAMGQGQPAAHRQKSGDGYFYIECDPLDVHDNGRPWESLYTHPQVSEWVKFSDAFPSAVPERDVEVANRFKRALMTSEYAARGSVNVCWTHWRELSALPEEVTG